MCPRGGADGDCREDKIPNALQPSRYNLNVGLNALTPLEPPSPMSLFLASWICCLIWPAASEVPVLSDENIN